jgi:hypothetical protein
MLRVPAWWNESAYYALDPGNTPWLLIISRREWSIHKRKVPVTPRTISARESSTASGKVSPKGE